MNNRVKELVKQGQIMSLLTLKPLMVMKYSFKFIVVIRVFLLLLGVLSSLAYSQSRNEIKNKIFKKIEALEKIEDINFVKSYQLFEDGRYTVYNFKINIYIENGEEKAQCYLFLKKTKNEKIIVFELDDPQLIISKFRLIHQQMKILQLEHPVKETGNLGTVLYMSEVKSKNGVSEIYEYEDKLLFGVSSKKDFVAVKKLQILRSELLKEVIKVEKFLNIEDIQASSYKFLNTEDIQPSDKGF